MGFILKTEIAATGASLPCATPVFGLMFSVLFAAESIYFSGCIVSGSRNGNSVNLPPSNSASFAG
jgi:hypothetical protein